MTKVIDQPGRMFKFVLFVAIPLTCILLLVLFPHLLSVIGVSWGPVQGSGLLGGTLAEHQKVAAVLSDEALRRRLSEIREGYIGAVDRSMVEAEFYQESRAYSEELLRRIRSGTNSESRLVELLADATVLEIETRRELPIVAGENCSVNTVVWMYPPLPMDIAYEKGHPDVEVSATLNGSPVETIATLSELRHPFVSWFKFQIRSGQFRPGENSLDVQAHVRILVPGERPRSLVTSMEWDTPVVNHTFLAEHQLSGELVRRVSNPEDVVRMKRQGRVYLGRRVPSERLFYVEFDFPALSVPICATVSVRASDGSWADEDQVLVMPAGPPSNVHLMAFWGENVEPPYEDNLRVDIEMRPAPQQAIWNDTPEIAGFCAKWENLTLGRDDPSSGMPPTLVKSTCSK